MSKTVAKTLVLLTAVALFSGLAAYGYRPHPTTQIGYSMVVLDSGLVFFGRLTNCESASPQLQEVFYIPNEIDPSTKQPKSVLLKRGSELHKPTRMNLSRTHIVFVEDVGKDSQVAHLIEAATHP